MYLFVEWLVDVWSND